MRTLIAALALAYMGCAGSRYDRGPRRFAQAEAAVQQVNQIAPSELAWFEVLVRAGTAHDPIGQEGIAYLTAQLLRQGGAGERSPAEVEAALVGLGADISVVVDKEMVSFRVTCMAEDAAQIASILGDMVAAPSLDKDIFARIRSESEAWLARGIVQNDEGLGDAVFDMRLFEGHRYAHPSRGRLGVLGVLSLDDVKRFLARRYVRPSIVLGVAGWVEQPVLDSLTRRLSETPARLYTDVTPRAVPEIHGRRVLIVEKPTEATGIHLGHVTKLTRSHADWPAMLLATTALGEHRQSHGRLYQALREDRGLNYGDYAYIEDYVQAGWSSRQQMGTGRRQNAFSLWIRPTEAANGPFALKAAIFELEAWVESGLAADEFTRMQTYLSSRIALWATDPGRRLGWATEAKLMDWPDPIADLPEQIRALSLDDVNAAIQRHVHPAKLDIVVVTKDGAGFRDAVVEENPTPIVYGGSPPPADSKQAQADAHISAIVLGVSGVELIQTEGLFR
jgi:zinc protease